MLGKVGSSGKGIAFLNWKGSSGRRQIKSQHVTGWLVPAYSLRAASAQLLEETLSTVCFNWVPASDVGFTWAGLLPGSSVLHLFPLSAHLHPVGSKTNPRVFQTTRWHLWQMHRWQPVSSSQIPVRPIASCAPEAASAVKRSLLPVPALSAVRSPHVLLQGLCSVWMDVWTLSELILVNYKDCQEPGDSLRWKALKKCATLIIYLLLSLLYRV